MANLTPDRVPSLRVLVVDDNPAVAGLLALLARRGGHQPRVAHTGPEALAAAAAFSPDLVLLAIGLPGMSGYEVARWLRGDPETAGATLVAVTGYTDDGHRQRLEAAGFDHYVARPVDAAELEELLRALARGNGERPQPGP
jgi:two-component system CheB/CheR fusion protein